jgi:hypothetical protein
MMIGGRGPVGQDAATMPKLSIFMSLCVLALAGDALAASGPEAAPSLSAAPAKPAARPKADPAKLKDCEKAWSMQRIRKGSHKAYIRACVGHG